MKPEAKKIYDRMYAEQRRTRRKAQEEERVMVYSMAMAAFEPGIPKRAINKTGNQT